jgi:hypothetical protein
MTGTRRAAWLAAVARALDASPEVEAEVLAELSAHLDDAAAAALEAGADPTAGERDALRALGDPAALGLELRRARRTPRAILALAGGGIRTFIGYSFAGTAIGLLGLTALIYAGFATLPSGTLGPTTSTVPLAAFLYGYAAQVTPSVVARGSAWSARSVGRLLAGALTVAGVPVALLFPGLQLDPVSALVVPATPLLAAAIAWRAPGRTSLRPSALVLGVTLLVALVVWQPWAGPRPTERVPGDAPVGLEAFGRPPTTPILASGGGLKGTGVDGEVELWIRFQDPLPAGSRLTYEAHLLRPDARGTWAVAPEPLVVATYALTGLEGTVTVATPVLREPAWIASATVLTNPDGTRTNLSGPQLEPSRPWRGSVLDWWAGR